MRKVYETPAISSQDVQLGVFGNYGEGDGTDTGRPVDITPIKIIDRFQLRMD